MSLVKTSLLNGIAVFVRMATLLGINKVLAFYVGPVGYATVGQFQSAVQMITTFASGAINTGVVRYTAEYDGFNEKLERLWKTSGSIALVGSIITTLLIVFFRVDLAIYFLKDASLADVFLWFGLFLSLFVLNTLLLAILNGKKALKAFISANISGSLFSLILTVFLAYRWSLKGALIALGVFQSLSFFITFFLCSRLEWFRVRSLVGKIDLTIAKNLLHYTLMSLSSALIGPIGQIYVRNLLGKELSWEAAGFWEAMWKLSAANLLFITSTLSVYYLPRLSVLKEKESLRTEVLSCFKIVLPVVGVVTISIYVFRFEIIRLLFSSEFEPIQSLFFWQLIGDFFKTASWLLGYIYIARGLTTLYFISEFLFVTLFCLAVKTLLPVYGLEATAISHAILYLFHGIFIYISLKIKRII